MNEKEKKQMIEEILDLSPDMRRIVQKPMQSQLKEIPMAQHMVMMNLADGSQKSMTQLAKMNGISNQQLTKIVEGLVSKNYVERVSDPQNRRLVLVHITPQGETYLEEAKLEILDRLCVVFEKFSDEDMKTLQECAVKMRYVFEKHLKDED